MNLGLRNAAHITLLCLMGALATSPSAFAPTYYVANGGSDTNDGCTPETAWKSIGKVNASQFQPGDAVLFHRGDTWREELMPCSGNESGCVMYGAYGEGPKPLLLGSVKRDRSKDWLHETGNIWATSGPYLVGGELLPNPSFSTDDVGWNLNCESGAAAEGSRDTAEFDSGTASYRIHVTQAGQRNSEIQFYTSPLRLEGGKTYRLTFRAKSDKTVRIDAPILMKSRAPWTQYGYVPHPDSCELGAEWKSFDFYYIAFYTDCNARLAFQFGQALPAGVTVHVDSFGLMECDGVLLVDVGNIIFNKEATCGVKVWNERDLREQGQFWYDQKRHILKMYSERSPAQSYSDIECALRYPIIDESDASYVVYEDLTLKYGAAHGIGGGNTHHITVRDCEVAFMGGGDQFGGGKTVRYGNGIEFWRDAHDILVERCRLWEIYDAALTNQSLGPDTPQYNVVYRFNVIWNCEYSFEYWNWSETSNTHHIRFENNTCVNAGHGWGHAQRPDPSGRHLCFFESPAPMHDFVIRNNIFCEATGNAFYAPLWPRHAIDTLQMDHNSWYQASGDMIRLKGASYEMSRFASYQAEWMTEPKSIAAIPGFVDAAHCDFHLGADSLCADAGADLRYSRDFDGVAIPQGRAPSIGAFEKK